jgi:hypothetical protein
MPDGGPDAGLALDVGPPLERQFQPDKANVAVFFAPAKGDTVTRIWIDGQPAIRNGRPISTASNDEPFWAAPTTFALEPGSYQLALVGEDFVGLVSWGELVLEAGHVYALIASGDPDAPDAVVHDLELPAPELDVTRYLAVNHDRGGAPVNLGRWIGDSSANCSPIEIAAAAVPPGGSWQADLDNVGVAMPPGLVVFHDEPGLEVGDLTGAQFCVGSWIDADLVVAVALARDPESTSAYWFFELELFHQAPALTTTSPPSERERADTTAPRSLGPGR